MPRLPHFFALLRVAAWSALLAPLALLTLHAHATTATPLPPEVQAALQRAKVPAQQVAVFIAPVQTDAEPWLAQRAGDAVNPASVMKLVTTYAALDLLGPAHVWRTRVLTDAPVAGGVLQGNLYLQGGGDPKLVAEKLWLLLRRVQALGIARIAGDIVLDRSAFDLAPVDPRAFDGEPLRPYNASPDALLINFKSQIFHFVPDAAAGLVRIGMEPPLAGVQLPADVPLVAGPCTDWRARLRADFSDALRPRFLGGYPAACGSAAWPLAHPQPERMAARAVQGMWQAVGGLLDGQVREGPTPPQAQERFAHDSPPLAEVVRDVNKFSNNVMAQHVLLALAQDVAAGAPSATPPATFARAQARVAQWWHERISATLAAPHIDNGAGLSRDARLNAQGLARMLQIAYASPMMAELMSSLPASGLDGTLRRSPIAAGIAHLKTGSLRDVQALAGYVHRSDGQRLVLVAIINHPNAGAARPALDALVQWAAQR